MNQKDLEEAILNLGQEIYDAEEGFGLKKPSAERLRKIVSEWFVKNRTKLKELVCIKGENTPRQSSQAATIILAIEVFKLINKDFGDSVAPAAAGVIALYGLENFCRDANPVK